MSKKNVMIDRDIEAEIEAQIEALAELEELGDKIIAYGRPVLITYKSGVISEVLPIYTFIYLNEDEFGFVPDNYDVDVSLYDLKAFKHDKKDNSFTFTYEHGVSVIHNVNALGKKIRKTIKKNAGGKTK